MDISQKMAVILIGLLTASLSLLVGGFLGGLNYISIIIAILPVVLGRIVFGRTVLDYIKPLYATTILFLSILQAPIKIFPDLYLDFYLGLYSAVFGMPEGPILGNLDAALAYEPILACIAVFGILYFYREGYLSSARRKLI